MKVYGCSTVCLLLFFGVFNGSHARYRANKKCAEYSKLPASFRKSGFSDDDSQDSNEEFPHMAALGYEDKGNLTWLCGGAVLSENYILTAAHCAYTRLYGGVKAVHVGSTNLNKGGVRLEIAKIITHPAYKPPSVYNDIALLQLKNFIRFSKSILPACLNTDFDVGPPTKVVATGWGKVSFKGSSSEDLLQVELGISTIRECNFSYWNVDKRKLPNGVESSIQICTQGSLNQDTCQGDSGGPLVTKTGELHAVVGIVSFGKACGSPDTPSINTRVSAYVPWIEQNVWP